MHPIYLTFDDGPDVESTPHILDVLAVHGAPATFFMIGQAALRAAPLARRIVQAGHALGNHTYSHRHPWFMTQRAARAEVRDGARAVSEAAGVAPRLFRPPHGRRRACMTEEAGRCGERVAMWNLSAVDWGPLGDAERIRRRIAKVQPNDVMLMHDGRNQHNRPDQLLRVLPEFLSSLHDRGLRPALLPNAQ